MRLIGPPYTPRPAGYSGDDVDTRADIVRSEWSSDRIAIVSVRWPLIDRNRREIGYEGSTYTLRRDDGGTLRIRSVVMHGALIENLS